MTSLAETSLAPLRPILCRSFEAYCRWCRSECDPRDLPVLEEAPAPREVQQAPSWSELAREVFEVAWRLRSSTGVFPTGAAAARVIALEGPSSIPGALLAGSLGLALRTVRGDLAAEALAEIRGHSEPLILVATHEEATDPLLFGLLQEVETALASDGPWDRLPRFTVIPGRDLPSLSWLVAKTIARSLEPDRKRAGWAHFTAGTTSTLVRARQDAPANGGQPERRELAGAELLAALTSPWAALGYQTHGFDACAKGGAGVVLCGLRSAFSPAPERRSGVLSCVQGHACPRGPHPLPLRDLKCDILMLGTCNGLRLGDSALTADFNLGLSFLEGEGLGYVGSLFSAPGSDLCSVACMAALASGCTLAEATELVNGLLLWGGIERAAYVALGLPDLRATDSPPAPDCEIRWSGDSSPLEIDFGSAHFATLLLNPDSLTGLVQERRFSLSVSSSVSGEPVFWFSRPERAAEGAGRKLRVFLFRFPVPLGRVSLVPHDRERLAGDLRDALEGLARWFEIARFAGISGQEPEIFEPLEKIRAEVCSLFAGHCARLRFDGSAQELFRHYAELVDSASALARESVLGGLLPRLAGPFWLTNLLSAEYAYEQPREAFCPHCNRPIPGKLVRHPLSLEQRIVDVCPRCGIVSDLRQGGPLARVVIEAPELVSAGSTVDLRVLVQARPGEAGASVLVCPRLSAHGLREVIPFPGESEAWIDSEAGESLLFRLEIPADLPPHQFFLKVLVATRREVGFASRLLFVHP